MNEMDPKTFWFYFLLQEMYFFLFISVDKTQGRRFVCYGIVFYLNNKLEKLLPHRFSYTDQDGEWRLPRDSSNHIKALRNQGIDAKVAR